MLGQRSSFLYKRIIAFLPLCFLIIHSSFAQEPLKIFIYAGQSNSQGRSTSLNSIPVGENDGKIRFAWNIQSSNNYLEEGWDTLQPVLRLNSQTNAIHAGELAFGRNLYEAGMEKVGIVKVAKSGTNLKGPWNPTFPRTSSLSGNGSGGMYWLMVNYVALKLADLDAQGIPYELEAILWHQGEADTRSSLALDYEKHFQQFVDSVKVHLDPDIEVYAVSVYNPSRAAEDVALVRSAQEAVASRNPHVHFVDLDSLRFDENGLPTDIYTSPDGVHYTTPGYFKVGDAFTEAYLRQNTLITCDTILTADSLNSILASAFPTSDCQAGDGRIVLTGHRDSLFFSIDGGLSFQDSNEFPFLPSGEYLLFVQDQEQLGCPIPFPGNPIVVESPSQPEIQSINPISTSQCESVDGGLIIQAVGDSLEYSLDREVFQATEEFTQLSAGTYWVYVRESAYPSCLDSLQVTVPKPSFCGPPECINSTNIALGALATQSTTRGNGLASFAVDGNLTGDDNWGDDANLQHTETVEGSWWKLDLGTAYNLDTLVIFNRTSTSSFILERLKDFYVFTSSDDIDGEKNIGDLQNDPAVADTFFSGTAGPIEILPLNHTLARYVLIKLSGKGPLHMAEVELYGCEPNPIVCNLSIEELFPTDVSSCGLEDGSIEIRSQGNPVEYSMNGGHTFQSDSVFSDLAAGEYALVVRELNEPSCTLVYPDNPIRISSPLDSLEIRSVSVESISDCDTINGQIEIVAKGENLEYSIDGGLNFAPSPNFDALDSGSYEIVIRDSIQSSCLKTYGQNPIAIHSPTFPQILDVFVQDISDCGLQDGEIAISALGDSLEFSINRGLTFQDTPIFSSLDSGAYEIVIREQGAPACFSVYAGNPLRIERPVFPQLIEVVVSDISACGLADGSIEIVATGNNLEYSIDDGLQFQSTPVFTGLREGPYTILVRDSLFTSCAARDSVATSIHTPPDCELCVSENLSLRTGVSTTQSTTRGNGVANFAIDGNRTGDDNWGSDADLQHTESVDNSWWMIDLGVIANLDSIIIYNRTTTNAFLLRRLRDFYVYISSTEIDGSRPIADLNTDSTIYHQHFFEEAGLVEELLLAEQPGRYVLLKLNGKGPLHMAEVEVWGCFESGIAPDNLRTSNWKHDQPSWVPLSLSVSPNPFNNTLRLGIQGLLGEGSYVQVVNVLGQILRSLPTSPKLDLDFKGLEKGLYWIQVQNGEQLKSVMVRKVR